MQSNLSPTFRRVVCAALCAGVVAMAGCAKQEPVRKTSKAKPLFVDKSTAPKPAKVPSEPKRATPKLTVTQHGVTLSWAEKNGTQMTASAKSASFNEVSQTGSLLDFSAELYENGKLTAAIRAPKATADTSKRVIVASGGVVLKSLERQTSVKAGWIKWYANRHKVVGDGGVKIKSASGIVEGAAFVADTSLKTLTIKDSGKGLEF